MSSMKHDDRTTGNARVCPESRDPAANVSQVTFPGGDSHD
jgi:hypothetical protein